MSTCDDRTRITHPIRTPVVALENVPGAAETVARRSSKACITTQPHGLGLSKLPMLPCRRGDGPGGRLERSFI